MLQVKGRLFAWKVEWLVLVPVDIYVATLEGCPQKERRYSGGIKSLV